MRKPLVLPGLFVLSAVTTAAYGGERTPDVPPSPAVWNVDAAHTEINFSVRHFFTPVTGGFDSYQVRLEFDPEDPEDSRVDVQIDAASVNTGNLKRDDHLRSADWFEVERYPTITFRSTSV